ncbi:MAG: hypothetical protein ACTSWN_08895 [Promethearchaeota archaeon]
MVDSQFIYIAVLVICRLMAMHGGHDRHRGRLVLPRTLIEMTVISAEP